MDDDCKSCANNTICPGFSGRCSSYYSADLAHREALQRAERYQAELIRREKKLRYSRASKK